MANAKPPDAAMVPLQINCRHAFNFRKSFPDCPALYFAVTPKYGLIYIGHTKSLKRRMRQHAWVLADVRIGWVTGLPRHDRIAVEAFLIKTCAPAWNIQHNNGRGKWK